MLRTAALTLALLLTGCGVSPLTAHISGATPLAAASTQRLPLHTFTSDAAGFNTHSFWLDTGREVIVFDAQFTPALANQLIAQIQAATRSPITTLVITHPNPDKFNGAPAFQAIGAKVVASAATAAALPGVYAYKKNYFVNVAKTFTDATYPALATVDTTFERTLALPGGIRLAVLNHAGVASTQTVASIPAARALIVGDLVHHQAHAWLEGGIVNGQPQLDLASWSAALDELQAYPGTTVYGGRGVPAPLAVAIADQQAYLRVASKLADAALAQLADPSSALVGPDAQRIQQALAAQIDAAFPGYALDYMTQDSVYGLVMAKLAGHS